MAAPTARRGRGIRAGGGNLTLRAGGDLTGDLMQALIGSGPTRRRCNDPGYNTAAIGNWLWRQGSGSILGRGTRSGDRLVHQFRQLRADRPARTRWSASPASARLGGGNLRVDVGGAMPASWRSGAGCQQSGGEEICAAGAGAGRSAAPDACWHNGSLSLTGGGDIDMRVGAPQRLHPQCRAKSNNIDKNAMLNGANRQSARHRHVAGRLALGALPTRLCRRAVGARYPRYRSVYIRKALAQIGIVLAPGDADLEHHHARRSGDQGRQRSRSRHPGEQGKAFALGPDDSDKGRGDSWFSLWTHYSAINLFSAGGISTPITTGAGIPTTDLA